MTDKNFTGPQGFRLEPLMPASGEAHILFLKRGLNRLGYYTPDNKTGMTPVTDQAFADALYAFQRKATIFFDDTEIGSGSTTERMLLQELARNNHDRYIWHTVCDEKVRGDHAAREGQVFSWDDPPEGGNPGEDYNCRCWAEPVNPEFHPWKEWARERILTEPGVDAIEPTWSPFDYMSIGGGGMLLKGSRKGAASVEKIFRNKQWTLGNNKSAIKWENRMKKRDWTAEKINETISKGKKFPAPNDINKGNKAMRYEYEGNFLVRDEKTKEIIQLGARHFIRRAK